MGSNIESEVSEAEIKDRLMAVHPALLYKDWIIEGCGNADRGFVVWDAMPPAGTTWQAHRLSFMEAIHTALAFCGTDTRDEWCVLGAMPLIYMRSMTGFEQVEALPCHPYVYIGKHKSIEMFTDASQHRPPRSEQEFVVGVRNKAARGIIQNAAVNMGRLPEPPDAPIWRAMQAVPDR